MKHPHENELALLASSDLGYFARRRVERHVATCDRCRAETQEFRSLRAELRPLNHLPELPWDRLAAEMKANIHVGLEAGECVSEGKWFVSPARAWMAYAGALGLVLIALWIGQPTPRALPSIQNDAVVLAATGNGIERKHAGSSLSLMHDRARGLTLSVNAQGSMRARYVDSETGQVTINNVYVQ